MGNKTIHEFSAPCATNMAIGPKIINEDANFKLKLVLIDAAKLVPFVGKLLRMPTHMSNTS
jgi:hypothetical protein